MNAIATAIATAPVKSGRKPARTDYVYTLESTDGWNHERKAYRTLRSARQAAGSSLLRPTTRKTGPNTWAVTSSVVTGYATIITRKALVN